MIEWIAKAILFDLDGVLVDSRACVEATWRRWAAQRGLDPEPFIQVAHGRRTGETLALVAPGLDIARAVAELDAIEETSTDGLLPVPGAAELIAALLPNQWAVVTSGHRAVAELRLRHVGLPVPEVLVTGDLVRRGKPDPEGYLLAAARIGVRPADCIVIEDAPPGVEAGKEAGMRVVGVAAYAHQSRGLGEADVVLSALVDLGVGGDPWLRIHALTAR